MRPTGMTRALIAAATLVVLCGCGAQSGSVAGAPATSASAQPSAVATTSASPATPIRPVPTNAGPTPAANSARLVYTSPAGYPPMHVSRTVVGSVYEHLVGVITELSKPVAGTAQCNMTTGEATVITLVHEGHTIVYTVPGVSCRNVRVTSDGQPQPSLSNSAAIIGAIRAIVGFRGQAHPMTG